MKKLLLIIFVSGFFLSGCVLSSSFNAKNIMEIKIHSSSETILNTFGMPVNVSSSICGAQSGGDPWNCTTWTYGERGYEYASFTFYHEEDKLYLNNFKIDRD